MPERRSSGHGDNRLSPQTLVVASLASLTAAIVVSTFWQGGTPIAAAVTPVVVAIASELYSRPARRITELSARAAERTRARQSAIYESARDRERVGGPPRRLPEERPPMREPEGTGPIRVYRSEGSSRRRIRLKAAIVTAAAAFVIAAIALTVPELVFGGSVASRGQTTFFGGHTHKHASKHKTTTSPTTTAPATTTPTPSATTTTPTAPPAQTTPQTTTPSTGTPAPQGTSTPSQTPGQ